MDYEQNVSHRVFGTPEVAQLVIEYLGDEQQSLHNLRLVSKQFNSLSVRECYRSLSLNMSRSKSLRLVKFMLAEPQYLGFVHEISVHACSSVFEAYWAVDSGENARAKESKYLSRLSSILMAFIQRIPRVRKFNWDIKETMPDELLTVLHNHPNSPTIGLVQEFLSIYQAIPSFEVLHARSTISALRLHIVLEDDELDSTNGCALAGKILTAIFGVISAQHECLEHLQLNIYIIEYDMLIPDKTASAVLASYRKPLTFPKLRTLEINGLDATFCPIPDDRVEDPSHFLVWCYPALEELRLSDFWGMMAFLGRLADQPLQLKQLEIVVKDYDYDHSLFADFLRSFNGLQVFKLMEYNEPYSMTYRETHTLVLDALIHHKASLKLLEIISVHDTDPCTYEPYLHAKLPFLENITEICSSLPKLEHLGLQFDLYHALNLWGEVKASTLRSMALYHRVPSADRRPAWMPMGDSYVDDDTKMAASQIMDSVPTLDTIAVYEQHCHEQGHCIHRDDQHIYTLCRHSNGPKAVRSRDFEAHTKLMKHLASNCGWEHVPAASHAELLKQWAEMDWHVWNIVQEDIDSLAMALGVV